MSPLPEDFDDIAALALLVDGPDPKEGSLRQIVAAAVHFVPGCETASITLVEGGQTYTPVAADGRAERADLAQYEEDSGPCLSAHRTGEIVHLTDITAGSGRYESFRAAAVTEGIRSSLSTPIQVRGRVRGALNLYSGLPRFDESALAKAPVIATQAAVLIENAALLERARTLLTNVNEALQSRDVIGQAKGILMATRKVTADEAFDLLREHSQREQLKLRHVAEGVARTGSLDT